MTSSCPLILSLIEYQNEKIAIQDLFIKIFWVEEKSVKRAFDLFVLRLTWEAIEIAFPLDGQLGTEFRIDLGIDGDIFQWGPF